MSTSTSPDKEVLLAMGRFLRERQSEIVQAWRQRVREIAKLSEISEPLLIDHIPLLLTRIAKELDAAADGRPAETAAAPPPHAGTRLSSGIELAQVLQEFSLLRVAVLELWRTQHPAGNDSASLRLTNQIIDHAAQTAAEHYADARDRALAALGELFDAGQKQRGYAFLQTALAVLMKSTVSVEAAVVLLDDGGRLRPHVVSGGRPAAREQPASADGPAGQAAASHRCVLERSTGRDFELLGLPPAEDTFRMVYAVPLISETRLRGVIEVAGCAGGELSRQDRVLLESLSHHVSSALVYHALQGELDRRTRELEQAKEILEHGDAMWVVDRDWRLIMVNRNQERISGTPREHVLGRDFWEVFPAAADPAGNFWREYHRVMRERVPSTFEEYYPPLDMWTDVTAYPAQGGGVAAFMRDVSEKKRIQRALHQAEQHVRLLDQAGQELSHLLDVNQALKRFGELVVGYMADWCVIDLLREDGGIETAAIVHPDPVKQEQIERLRERFPLSSRRDKGSRQAIETGRSKLTPRIRPEMVAELVGEPEYAELLSTFGLRSGMVVPLIARGRVLGAISLVMGDSGREYGEEDLAIATELAARAAIAIDNARLYEQAQRAVKLRENILAIVSHDLKSPLGTINLSAGLLLRHIRTGGQSQAQEPLLERIQRSGQQMERLIGDLLDMASIQSGKLAVSVAPEAATELIAEAVELQRPLAQEKGLSLRAQVELDPQLRVCCDRARILQVLNNLIGNAIKFTPSGGWIKVDAGLTEDAAHVRVSVRDNGPGIPAEDQPQVFDAYHSGDQHRHLGSGLGLFISKGIIEAHGGELSVHSVPGAGSRFSFSLRREDWASPPPPAAASPAAGARPG